MCYLAQVLEHWQDGNWICVKGSNIYCNMLTLSAAIQNGVKAVMKFYEVKTPI